jgi:acetylornithine deacetylase
MALSVTELLSDLVSIPSVNPTGGPLQDETYGEARLARFVAEYLTGVGLKPEVLKAPDGRDSVYAVLDAGREETVLLEAHLDTVPPNPDQGDPFTPRIEKGRLFGRGACDTKGSMAAMLTALARIIDSGEEPAVNIIFAAAADEEYGMLGSRALAEKLEGKAGFAVIGEPTRLRMATSHKGVIRWRVTAWGKGAHAATPTLGENAIYRAARLVSAAEEHAESLSTGASHPVLGEGTLSVGTIVGGSGVNTVPEGCSFTIDRRYLPNESLEKVEADLTAALSSAVPPGGWTIERLPSECPPLDTAEDTALVRRIQKALEAEGLDPSAIPLPYATDAAMFARHGIPGVILGPGDAAEAHTAEESIDLGELEKAVGVFRRIVEEGTLG